MFPFLKWSFLTTLALLACGGAAAFEFLPGEYEGLREIAATWRVLALLEIVLSWGFLK